MSESTPHVSASGVPDYGNLPDADLVVRTQAGDNRAFDELVKRYREKVYRLAFKILRHEDDAAEALQDAFLSAYRGLKNFKAESTFSTWLYRITTNAALMKYRKRREGHMSLEQSQSRDGETHPIELADWSAIPDDELEDRETWEVLVQAVDKLPEDLRLVFYRRDWLEESNAEVAESLGISVAAVKSRLHRARIQLRDRLNRYFAGKTAKGGSALKRRGPDSAE
jgi:RNA polymerase sigma-70 factor (ECF subfamily)